MIAFGKGGGFRNCASVWYVESDRIILCYQDIASVVDAVSSFEKASTSILPHDCRDNALRFSVSRFQHEMEQYVNNKWGAFSSSKLSVIDFTSLFIYSVLTL